MTTNEEADIGALAGATLRLLRGAGERAVPFLADWPAPAAAQRRPAPCALPVLRWLEPACRNGFPGAKDALAALEQAAPRLAWRQTYGVEDFGAAFLERYGWTEVIGERGPIASDRVAIGFLLLGPDVTYPSHSHDAEEIYLTISGAGAWRRGADPWRDEPPGAVVHHPSRTPHAIRTGPAPLLALYAWRGGDLRQKSTIE
jgi:mannose-6-phosphate isomerase-like protein (cupin superfamily)